MIIDNISVRCNAHVNCHSGLYSTWSSIDCAYEKQAYSLKPGINFFHGEIDTVGWALSYFISMYSKRSKDFYLYEPEITINGEAVSPEELTKYACYIDLSYPLFRSKASVHRLIDRGLKKSNLPYDTESVKELFRLDNERFERRLAAVGHERYRAMPAVALCYQKEIYCFPWISSRTFRAVRCQVLFAAKVLAELGKIVVLPVADGADITMPDFSDF